MTLTKRQIFNNYSLIRKINQSSIGERFQNSKFAREIESRIHLFSQEFYDSIDKGFGVFESFLRGITESHDKSSRNYYVNHRLETERPDLNGVIKPSDYDKAIRLQNSGFTKYEVPRILNRKKIDVFNILNRE